MLVLRVENLGPLSDAELRFDRPVVIVTGDTGTGKSLILRVLQILLSEVFSVDDPREAEYSLATRFREEFGSIPSLVKSGAEEAVVELECDGEVVARIILREERVCVEESSWSEALERRRELRGRAERSLVAPDTRIALVRSLFAGRSMERTPTEEIFVKAFRSLLGDEVGHFYLNVALSPFRKAGLLKGPALWRYGVLDGIPVHDHSASILSLLSLAPVLKALGPVYGKEEWRAEGLLLGVDTVELHLTPLYQGVAATLMARAAVGAWREAEEQAPPLIMTTHSSIVLAALNQELIKGVKDDLLPEILSSEYRVTEESIVSYVFSRDEGGAKVEVFERKVPAPKYMAEYLDLFRD